MVGRPSVVARIRHKTPSRTLGSATEGGAPLQFPRELFEFKSGIRLRGAVLQRAADVDKCKGELEDDEGVGVVVPAPDDPEHVTNQDKPEAPVAFINIRDRKST